MLYMAFLVLAPVISWISNLLAIFPSFDERMIYPFKAVCVALTLAFLWRHFEELRKFRLEFYEILWSVAVGVGVFLLWINLDQEWMSTGDAAGYDPRDPSGAITWFLALPRLLGAILVIPIMEELFWRSFLMRWIEQKNFLEVSPSLIGPRALLIGSVLFALGHTLWLAGLVAGLAYGTLYIRKSSNLWAPILAHATTNGLLGLWALLKARFSTPKGGVK